MFKEVSHSVRDYMPNCETNYRFVYILAKKNIFKNSVKLKNIYFRYSPFVVRNREGKRREEANANNVKSSFAALMSWGSGMNDFHFNILYKTSISLQLFITYLKFQVHLQV